jgi:hypothetical protein
MAIAKAEAEMSSTPTDRQSRRLPPVNLMRGVSAALAKAVARQAQVTVWFRLSVHGLRSRLRPWSPSMCPEIGHERDDPLPFRA